MKRFFPSFIRTACVLWLAFWTVLFTARLVLLGYVWAEAKALETGVLIKALYIGAKFDARLAVFVCILPALFLSLPFLERHLPRLRFALAALYSLVFGGIALIYALDFGFYFYLRQRLDATLIDLLADTGLSLSMVWQSYPVVWIGLGLAAFGLAGAFGLYTLLNRHKAVALGGKKRSAWCVALFVLFFGLAYGQISSNLFPLRWSNAYFHPTPVVAHLALNPVQNFYDSLRARKNTLPNEAKTREAYPRMAEWLGVEKPEPFMFWRSHAAQPERLAEKLNVVVIIMESLGSPRTSVFAGPDAKVPHDPTPNLRRLMPQSLYFSNFFAPTRTTARAVFTTVTGIPDINRAGGTSSRNPALVDQFSVLSEFGGYDKYYMIGGSASWANIRGVLQHNIEGLKLLEEGAWKAPNADVWGLSDLDLFRESIGYLNRAEKPFVSVIQTAGFHRPWTIPDDNAGFVQGDVPQSVISYYGFENQQEYQSMRFSDHALGEFFRLAAKEPWFSNTVFAILGDHGLYGASENVSAAYLACTLEGYHVPLLLYAPGRPDLIRPGEETFPAGQPDVLPTLASLAGVGFHNHTMGRNLLDPHTKATARQFIAGNDEPFMRVVEDGYCYFKEQEEALYRLDDPKATNLMELEPQRVERLRQFAADVFVTAKYMLYNNRKKSLPSRAE